MRHMGNSGKFAVISGRRRPGHAGADRHHPRRGRDGHLPGARCPGLRRGGGGGPGPADAAWPCWPPAAGTSLTIAFSLAFLSTWELAFADQSSFLGTPLPTGDPDNYFFWAAASAVATLVVLFLGAVWPSGRRLGPARRRPRRPSGGPRPLPAGRPPGARPPGTHRAHRGRAQPSRAARNARRQRHRRRAPSGRTGQRASGSRAPARLPAAAAKRPSSSASPVRKPAPKPGTRTAPNRVPALTRRCAPAGEHRRRHPAQEEQPASQFGRRWHLPQRQPGSAHPHHGHQQGEGNHGRRRVAGQQPVPDSVPHQRRENGGVQRAEDRGRLQVGQRAEHGVRTVHQQRQAGKGQRHHCAGPDHQPQP